MRLIIRWSTPAHPFRPARQPVWLDRLRCALVGHDDEIVLGQRVMSLRCRRCNWRSSGWRLDHAGNLASSREATSPKPRLPAVWRARTTT